MQVLGVPSEIIMKDFAHVINDQEIVNTQEDSSDFSKGTAILWQTAMLSILILFFDLSVL